MKIFLLGDTLSQDGPGIANKAIAEALRKKHELTVSSVGSRIARIPDAICGILKSRVTVICSKSSLNRFAVRFAKVVKKPVLYIMHGYASLEAVLNNEVLFDSPKHKSLKNYDRLMLSRSERTVCVSPMQMNRLKQDFPEYADRITWIWNAVPLPETQSVSQGKDLRILSVGADQKIKNCVTLVKAVGLLRRSGLNCSLILVGQKRDEYEHLSNKDGITWLEPMPHTDLLKLMSTCSIYVQCSLFDTFAMAPVEALLSGSSILVSDRVGCKDLFPSLLPDEILSESEDPVTIAASIRSLADRGGNRERLLKDPLQEKIGIQALSDRLDTILSSVS